MLAVDYQCSGVTMLVGAGVVKTPRRGEGVRMSTEESAFRSTGSATAASGAPSDAADASVVWMFTSPTAGAPMEQQGSVVVVPGVGIVGDRYALGTGHWSAPRWPDQQLTLFEVEVAEELGCEPYEARRNIVTRGVRLFGLIGVRFRIGGALLAGVRACDPCSYIGEVRVRQHHAHLLLDEACPVGVHEVALGQHDDCVAHLEQVEDLLRGVELRAAVVERGEESRCAQPFDHQAGARRRDPKDVGDDWCADHWPHQQFLHESAGVRGGVCSLEAAPIFLM